MKEKPLHYLASFFVGESLIIKLSSVFIFDDPLALMELRLTDAILQGGLNGAVFGRHTRIVSRLWDGAGDGCS